MRSSIVHEKQHYNIERMTRNNIERVGYILWAATTQSYLASQFVLFAFLNGQHIYP